MPIRFFTLLILVCLSSFAWANNPFENIDAHARACPDSQTKSIESLAAYLLEVADTDLEKSRAAYVWLTENIYYDDQAFNTGRTRNVFPKAVLQNRRAVCEGFSNLFQKLGEEMGLNIKKVVGFAKGIEYRSGRPMKTPDHAWNIIEIDGEWRIFDATWGSGYAEVKAGKLKTRKVFEDFWFYLDPYKAIFTHLPQNRDFAFIQPIPTPTEFKQLPRISTNYFKIGFEAKEVYAAALTDHRIQFPKYFDVKTKIELKSAPMAGVLQSGKSYQFEFYIPKGIEMAVITDKKDWTSIEAEDGKFSFEYTPQKETSFKVSVQHEGGEDLFHTILRYEVK